MAKVQDRKLRRYFGHLFRLDGLSPASGTLNYLDLLHLFDLNIIQTTLWLPLLSEKIFVDNIE